MRASEFTGEREVAAHWKEENFAGGLAKQGHSYRTNRYNLCGVDQLGQVGKCAAGLRASLQAVSASAGLQGAKFGSTGKLRLRKDTGRFRHAAVGQAGTGSRPLLQHPTLCVTWAVCSIFEAVWDKGCASLNG